MSDRKDFIRTLYYSDNLPVLKQMEDETIDLIYLDPPFNSNRAYNIIYPNDMGQITAFEDTWSWTPECDVHLRELKDSNVRNILNALVNAIGKIQICAYLVSMTVRLVELKRILKSSGSIYLHCDQTAGHYLKVVMDAIFDKKNFCNDIIWGYRTGGVSKKYWPKKHDNILFYKKSSAYRHNPPQERIYYDKPFFTDKVDMAGKPYADVYIRDVWEDIKPIINISKESLGYPTQKPIKLLERIVEASSNQSDLVLDPFCGCGTTIAAAEKLKRNWIGIDITYSSIAAIKERFKRQRLDIWGELKILGIPETKEEVESNLINSESARARKEFEKFCVSTIGGMPNDKMGADGGIDGKIFLQNGNYAIVSVKSGHVNVRQIRELKGLLNRKKIIGIFITKEDPTKSMIEFANQSGFYEDKIEIMNKIKYIPKIQILTLEQLLRGEQPILPQ